MTKSTKKTNKPLKSFVVWYDITVFHESVVKAHSKKEAMLKVLEVEPCARIDDCFKIKSKE